MFLMAGGCIHHEELQVSRATSLGTARSGAVAALGGGIAAARSFYGAEINSVSTTLLIAARLYELHRGRQRRAVRDAQRRGREFLLVHRLFRSHRTGEIIKPVFTRFAFPPRWHYDILRALDYFQAVDAPCDPRLADAIAIVQSSQRADGRWSLQHAYKGKTYFELERPGAPSRWNTLRALRVLKWWRA